MGCSPQVPSGPQVAGGVQSPSFVHVFTQAAPVAGAAQRPGAQLMVAGVTQVPVPLQVEAGARVDELVQLAAAHWLPEAQRAHCPAVHWPVVPQVD